MNWKKNVISYLMWFLYACLTTAALVSLGGLYCKETGLDFCWGVLLAAVYIGLAGGIVLFLRKLAPWYTSFAGKRRGVLLAAETALAVVLLALGLLLRVRGMGGILQSSEYYEAAKVAAGRGIPQVVHGAVYFYLQILHALFLLVGNHFMAGIWLQIVLQLLGSLFLFFAVRKLAGRIAALTVFGFCMCGPFMVGEALVLSPEILYFVLFSLAALLISAGRRHGKRPEFLLLSGILAAFCAYIDIVGILLLFLILLAVLDYERENTGSGRRTEAVLLCVAVFVLFILGILLCVFSDAFFSGKSFLGVIEAWLRLYSPESFRLPVTIGSAGSWAENLILFGSMVFGVFSFWCDRKRERISPCIAGIGLLVLGMCHGILTEEMPGYHYMYLLLALLAGIGLGQCFQPACASRAGEDAGNDDIAEVSAGKENLDEKERSEEKENLLENADKGEKESTEEKESIKEKESIEQKGSTEQKESISGNSAIEEKESAAHNSITGEKEISSDKERIKGKAEKEQGEAMERKDEEAPGEKPQEMTEKEAAGKKEEEALEELEREKALQEEFREEAARRKEGQEPVEEKKQVKYIENPLPLPKKHKKRVMEYPRHIAEDDDFDHPVDENDDFDI